MTPRHPRARRREDEPPVESVRSTIHSDCKAVYFPRPFFSFTSVSTTPGSASVVISPSASNSSAAIFLKMRRMIFPDRVFGSPGAQWITSGCASAPIAAAHVLHQLGAQGVGGLDARLQRHVGVDALALRSCGNPTTADSATSLCETSALSTSAVPSRWPLTLITSSTGR